MLHGNIDIFLCTLALKYHLSILLFLIFTIKITIYLKITVIDTAKVLFLKNRLIFKMFAFLLFAFPFSKVKRDFAINKCEILQPKFLFSKF